MSAHASLRQQSESGERRTMLRNGIDPLVQSGVQFRHGALFPLRADVAKGLLGLVDRILATNVKTLG